MKKRALSEIQTFNSDQFGWFAGHDGPGDTSLSRLGINGKGRVPISFTVSFPKGDRLFTHQYDVTSDSDDYRSKWMAVYWCGDQIIHLHRC